jgi:O-antigen ligase
MLAAPFRVQWPAVLVSCLFFAALVSALFFQGFYTEFFGLSLTFLILWLACAVWQGCRHGFQIPKTGVVLWLTLFWIWLGISISWARVFYVGVIDWWWVGSLPLTFWIYTLSPEKEKIWQLAFPLAVVTGVVLASTATYQSLFLGLEPTGTFLCKNSLAALLILTALPLCAYFLLNHDSRRSTRGLLGAAVFVLFFAIALIKGRGVILSGVASLGILILVAARQVPKKTIMWLLAIVIGAFVAANGVGQLDLAGRMGTVTDPWNAGATRFIIWSQAWEMLKESPWLGVGSGQFALLWPPYRHPDDSSAGYFVHNDYLQLWIETGLPGLLLLLAAFIAVAYLFVRATRHAQTAPRDKIEMAGLFCGLLAVALHSFVDFNLHVLSILILAGLILGRLHALATKTTQPSYLVISPQKFVSVGGYRVIAILLLVFPLMYFVALGSASYEYRRAMQLAEEGKLEASYYVFNVAARLFPNADNVLMSQADLVRHLITALPETSQLQKKALLDEARELLDEAEGINPLRPQTYVVRAQLYEQNPSLIGKDWSGQAVNAYRQALQVNPRIYEIRYLYGQLLLKLGRFEEAHRVLEEGMRYWYFEYEHIIPFYALVERLRREAGDKAGADQLNRKIAEVLKNSGRRRVQYQEKASPIVAGIPDKAPVSSTVGQTR